MNIPRNEYPRPRFVRDKWMNLNGEWDFAFDFGKSGKARGMVENGKYDLKIQVKLMIYIFMMLLSLEQLCE